MGRIGVTLLDVEKAALQLQGRGKKPSVDAVREMLGTGSKSTIAQHLRSWRAQQTETQGTLPQELLALVTGLWEQLNGRADQRIAEVEASTSQVEQELKQTITRLQQEGTQLQTQLHQSEEFGVTERSAKEKLEKELDKEQQKHGKLLERHQTMMQQLEDYKTENARLHQLANNIQANLEHYQNAIQQLRTEQNLAIEKQQLQFQQEIARLQQELLSQHQQLQENEKQLNNKVIEIQQVNDKYQSLQEGHNSLIACHQKTEYELIILQDRYKQQEKVTSVQEQELVSKNKRIIESEKQEAILEEQKFQLEKTLSQMEDKIEALRQEKIFLVQEKFELQGHLKQLMGKTSLSDS